MTEIEGKVKYVKLARSLQTYGVSFFLVKVRAKTALMYECSHILWRVPGAEQKETFARPQKKEEKKKEGTLDFCH